MAVASPHQPPTLQQLTPPNSSHGGRGSWDFAVPLDNGKTTADQKPLMSEDVPAAQLLSSRQPLAPQPNGVTKQPRSNTLDSQRQRYDEDAGYLAPTRVNELQRKGSDISANSSDPDSLLDYYKNSESKNGSRTASQTAANKKKTAGGANWTEAEKDENNWIHRDKLKEIETKELEEAGFPVGRTSRSNSRSHSASVGARDRRNSEANDAAHNGDDRHDKRRVVSPIPAEDEEGDDDPAQWDLRTPDEIAAEREISPPRNHIIRPSTSRIPIAKTSPAPVPHAYVERDVPLPRSRKGSANWTGDAIATNGARVRSGSTSSQVLMDDLEGSGDHLKTPLRGDFSSPTSPVTGSPPKAKTPGKLAPISGGRKGTAQRSTSTAKSRNTSATSPAKRPGTSGGSISRPTTGHRPEGDPPWMATMYKPDPRLPPDQQIIPTHAKRMQQEQWEIEGKHGSIYDREFRLLNTEEFNKRDSQILQPTDNQKDEDDQQWPLPSPTKNSPGRQDTGLKSPTNEQGGYKLTPKIPQSPRIPSRNSGHRSTASPKNTNTTRLPEPSAEEKQKKNCCCIVM